MKKKNGFTLIELLAVIIILGILMIIAIPSVTKYISDSRKSAYVDTAKEIISGARNMVNDGKLEMYDTGTTYYIDAACIKTENGEAKSPYGEFTKAYVVVIYDGKGYEYYWTSVDDAGQGIKGIVKNEMLDSDQIESDLKDADITTDRGVDGRSNVQVISEENGCKKGDSSSASSYVSINGESTGAVMYPQGKNGNDLQIGDLVKIGNQEFYFAGYEGEHKKLLARYNLKVGGIYNSSKTKIGEYSTSDAGYGLQNSEVKGLNSGDNSANIYGTVKFASTTYWSGQLGSGKKYPDRYVYDSNSILYSYIENYKRYIESLGVTVYGARVMKFNEFNVLHGVLSDEIVNGSFWLGDIPTVFNDRLYSVSYGTVYPIEAVQYYTANASGVRPLIII